MPAMLYTAQLAGCTVVNKLDMSTNQMDSTCILHEYSVILTAKAGIYDITQRETSCSQNNEIHLNSKDKQRSLNF